MLRVSNKANKVTQTHGVSYIQDRYIDIRRCIHIHYIIHIHILCKHIYIYIEREKGRVYAKASGRTLNGVGFRFGFRFCFWFRLLFVCEIAAT